MLVIKRDGQKVEFDDTKIYNAIEQANEEVKAVNAAASMTEEEIDSVVDRIIELIDNKTVSVEDIQDLVEAVLISRNYAFVARAYIRYRYKKELLRKNKFDLMEIYEELTYADAKDADIKRENANIDADTSMGTMLKYGSEGAKYFVDNYVLPKDIAAAHINGDIHIHDKDFYMLTETCCQIDLIKLFKNGFFTGHGYLREPNSIMSYASLACIAIQANQNEMHGGQSIPNFDYAMADGVKKSFRKHYVNGMKYVENWVFPEQDFHDVISIEDPKYKKFSKAYDYAMQLTEKETYQAMEALIHNLNTMQARAGAQVPFSSINYGTDVSPEGRMVIKCLLRATYNGLGNGETPIFPVQIFKVKEGINFNNEDLNYDLFKMAIQCSAKRLFPNFSFLDAPFNLPFYKEGDYDTEVAYMGCRTRVMANNYDKDKQVVCGRGNLSFTSINLPRLAIESEHNIDTFYSKLDEMLELVARQLLHRFKIQCSKKGRNYPFLMGQGVWLDSDGIGPDDSVEEILKHGTLSIGFIGLAETMKALVGKHHGEDEEARKIAFEIITHMREFCDNKSAETGLNFTLLATPAEGLSGRFVKIDKQRYGELEGITDREYYTNSFHVPVYYPISAFEKLSIEAPYHNLTNAGHISYVELDGDTAKNPEAFEAIIRYMKEVGIGYGSVNHPVDRDPVCGYTGVIDDICPRCGRKEGESVSVELLNKLRMKYPSVPIPCDCTR